MSRMQLLFAAIMVAALSAAAASGFDFKDALKKGKDVVDKAKDADKKEKDKEKEPEAKTPPTSQPGTGTAVTANRIVFSTKPIDPSAPADLATTFKAPDRIYGLIQLTTTWRELYEAKGKSTLEVQIRFLVDGEKIKEYQYVVMKRSADIDGRLLVLDIAPDAGKMVAYVDANFDYGRGKGNRLIGPDTFTFNLASLEGGKHAVRLEVFHFGKVHAAGEFVIEGEDFKPYGELRKEILAIVEKGKKVPPAKNTDAAMEEKIYDLCVKAGMTGLVGLNIIDNDWWTVHKEGSNTEVVSRHMEAAVVSRESNGDVHYQICRFQETWEVGGYLPMTLVEKGKKVAVAAENAEVHFKAPPAEKPKSK